MINLFR